MNREVKKYYELNFGSFTRIGAKDIATLCGYEWSLMEMPDVFFSFESISNDRLLLQQKLKKALAYSYN